MSRALALLGGIAAGVGLKKVNPTVHLGQVNRSVKKAEGKGHVEQTYKRSSGFRKGVRDEVWEKAKDTNGKVRDPLTNTIMKMNLGNIKRGQWKEVSLGNSS